MTLSIGIFAGVIVLFVHANARYWSHRSRLSKRQKQHEDRLEEREAAIW